MYGMTRSDEKVFAAARSYTEAWMASIPEKEENMHRFSEKFEQDMQPVLEKGRRRAGKRAVLLRAAAAALVIALIGGIWAGVSLRNRAQANDAALPEDSIFREIILQGMDTYVNGIHYGMTFEEVLASQGLTENELDIMEATTDDGKTIAQVKTLKEYDYGECPGFGLRKFFEFEDGKLRRMFYFQSFDGSEFEERIGQLTAFVDNVIENSGAAPLENVEKLEYWIEGAVPETLEECGYYAAVFAPGIFGSAGFSVQDMRSSTWYEGDYQINVSVRVVFQRGQRG